MELQFERKVALDGYKTVTNTEEVGPPQIWLGIYKIVKSNIDTSGK